MRKAREGNLRSRALFKLEQLDRRDRLFRPGQKVVDLGAAPGGWSQYLAGRARCGTVVAVDLLDMASIDGVSFIRGDFLDESVSARILEALEGSLADAVVSDMAPNLSGVRERDEARMEALVEAALALAPRVLRRGGLMVVKVFEGASRAALAASFNERFDAVHTRKPEASRSASAECYIVAKGYNPTKDGA